jgi:hypothetical protein
MTLPRAWLSCLFGRPSLPARRAGLKRHRARPSLESLEDRLVPSVYSVTGTADNVLAVDTNHAGTAADPYLAPSLRSAVNAANGHAGADTITFEPTMLPGGTTITLGGTMLELSDAVTIAAPAGVTVSGNNLSRVFQIDSGVTAAFTGLTILSPFPK